MPVVNLMFYAKRPHLLHHDMSTKKVFCKHEMQ